LATVACDNDKKSGASTDAQGGNGGMAGAQTEILETAGAAQAGSPESGAGGSAGASSVAGVAGQTSIEMLVDDFEDGDGRPLISGGWYTFTDQTNGGGSVLTMPGTTGSAFVANGEGYASAKSLQVDYSFDKGTLTYQPYIGVGVSVGDATKPLDLSAFTGISYQYRGGAHRLRVENTEVTDWDFFGVDLPASTSWKTVTVLLKDMTQEGWGKKVALVPAHVTALSFYARGETGGKASLQVDNLKVVGNSTAAATPDMTINPPSPPADVTLASIEIPNPLQAKAMAYLTRGYNITNWLEEGRFESFKYDEAFVKQLATAGFKSLRLPIDLDRYVATKTGSGETLSVTIHDDLWKILDSFDTWTKTYGLSLTIDYHEYDKSITLADPDSLNLAVLLWGKVAEHFTASPREDLFFELLNEPELSFGGTAPTQAQWTALAERMIAAIRASDTAHSILFGDVNWYGIGPLTSRTPFADPNVIYVFHNYDPFIFTHQGASWANMASTHDLPYPYAEARWSQYFSDLGFTPYMESWILNSVRNYYREGTRSALRNQFAQAKRWAVTNNVPVICNEFGAYDLRSRLEDRVRYYADVVGIFEELAIPWQQWFMVMDSSGTVQPEIAKAMHLGM
jgi:licheninase